MIEELTERFSDLSPAEQAAIEAVYQQQTCSWVPVGTAGFVWQVKRAPKTVVRKARLQEALVDVNQELSDLGYSNKADIIALFETEKISLGYDVAVGNFFERVRRLVELKRWKQEIKDFIAEITT